MQDLINDLQHRKKIAENIGGTAKIEKQHKLNRLTARERIDHLLDKNSFLELGKLNHTEESGYDDRNYGDGIIGGLGKINGRSVVVLAMDKTVFAGTEGSVSWRKSKKIHEFALKHSLPIFHLGEGGGLRIPDGMGSDGISEKIMPAYLTKHNRRVPFFTSILGDSYGWSTWMAASSDIVVQTKGTCMAVAGPRMLEIATGEKIDPEELGGWKIHAEQTGQVDLFADSDETAINEMRKVFEYFPSNPKEEPPHKSTQDNPNRILEGIEDIVSTNRKRAYDMKKVIKLIVDDGDFYEIKPLFGRALLTCFGRINGRVVGIMANQPMRNAGAAGPNECDKATEFICLCDSWNIPMIFLHDIPGFHIASAAEKKKMPTKIMVWNQAIAKATVPKISIVLRKSIGAAYGNMGGPSLGDFVFAWPTAEINFTGPEVGINVVYGNKLKNSSDPEAERSELLQRWEFDSGPYKAAEKHLIDDVIDPRDTRKILVQSLDFACNDNGSISHRLLANWPTGF
ncbi:acyl-CoA carboxylase subunit beta [Oceanobacillus halophilus]|uniref:Methylmalonyl-CoA decarboxylase n=1 Tax=Oceanobacillus halophilus TaxID=930130 RepID=A0A495ABG4_9BACI|nr:carboxyl transferase domain-containing protein [Oceanobacillus halophilus]RKQ35766.1 methylmalonyl-CoA decarboxylase [Oceanobacillus halophilus]